MTPPRETAYEAPTHYLPHRPPAVMLDAITHLDDTHCRACFTVDPGAWYAQADGSMPGWFGIELMAQTISAYSGALRRTQGQQPTVGFLLGAQSYDSVAAAYPAGARLEISVQSFFQDPSGIAMQQEGWIAPTLHLDTPDPRCAPLDYIQTEPRNTPGDIFITNNFAFGGINTALVIKV